MNEIVENIQRLAKEQDKSVKEIALQSGVGENSIYRWKNSEPKISTLKKVAKVLGVDYKLLLP